MCAVDLTRSMLLARSGGITFHPALVYKPNRVETRLLGAAFACGFRSSLPGTPGEAARYVRLLLATVPSFGKSSVEGHPIDERLRIAIRTRAASRSFGSSTSHE